MEFRYIYLSFVNIIRPYVMYIQKHQPKRDSFPTNPKKRLKYRKVEVKSQRWYLIFIILEKRPNR